MAIPATVMAPAGARPAVRPAGDPGAQSDAETRNEVLLRYLPLVRYVARRVASSCGLPAGVERNDLVSYGIFGLLDAYERYDEARGVKFETFAVPRIRGAIMDELRHHDWVPRNVRSRARRLNEVETRLTGTLGRAPTREEIAEGLGVDDVDRFEARGTPVTLVALDTLTASSASGTIPVGDVLVDASAEQPGEALEDSEMRAMLTGALAELGERDRLILTLYYFEQVPLGEVAKLLGVTESRVSQLHTRALHSLRDKLHAS